MTRLSQPADRPAAAVASARRPFDADLFTRVARDALSVRRAADFENLVRHPVRTLLPHGLLLAAVGRLAFGQIEAVRVLGVDAPPGFLSEASQTVHLRERPGLHRWLSTRQPVVIAPDEADSLLAARGLREVRQYALGTLAVHGTVDLSANMGSYFFFGRVDAGLPASEISRRLQLLVPLLHTAFLQIEDLPDCRPNLLDRLSEVEQELLAWVAAGRTNTQIAQMRGRSPSTVRNQLEEIYRKLGVGNRAEATHLAASLGLLTRFAGRFAVRPPAPPPEA